MARQLFSLGGVSTLSDDNLRSLGLGILGAPLTDLAPAGVLGTGSMLAQNINRPTSGYETKEGREQRNKAMEELEKEGIFEQLGISPEDLRSPTNERNRKSISSWSNMPLEQELVNG